MNILIFKMCHMELVPTAYYVQHTAVKITGKIWSYVNGYKFRVSNKSVHMLKSFSVAFLL